MPILVQPPEPKSAFFITPIGAVGSPERFRADQLHDHVLTQLLSELGYRLTRGDRDPDPGQILEAVLEQIVHADLIIADITGRNPNVFYELAVAHAAQRRTIMIQEGDERLPFDVANLRAIPYDIGCPSGTEDLRRAVRAAVESVENGAPLRSPLQGFYFGTEPQVLDAIERDPVAVELGALRDEVRALGAEIRRPEPIRPMEWSAEQGRVIFTLWKLLEEDPKAMREHVVDRLASALMSPHRKQDLTELFGDPGIGRAVVALIPQVRRLVLSQPRVSSHGAAKDVLLRALEMMDEVMGSAERLQLPDEAPRVE